MPEKPREGSSGHQSSHSEWASSPEETGNETGEQSKSRRRRRALGDDGTGGTRVGDLLSKHGKRQTQSTGSHRRIEETEQDAPQDPPPQSPQPPATDGRRAAGNGEAPTRADEGETSARQPAPEAPNARPGRTRRARRRAQHASEQEDEAHHQGPSPGEWRAPAGEDKQQSPAAPPPQESDPVNKADDTARIPPFRGAPRRPNGPRNRPNERPATEQRPHSSGTAAPEEAATSVRPAPDSGAPPAFTPPAPPAPHQQFPPAAGARQQESGQLSESADQDATLQHPPVRAPHAPETRQIPASGAPPAGPAAPGAVPPASPANTPAAAGPRPGGEVPENPPPHRPHADTSAREVAPEEAPTRYEPLPSAPERARSDIADAEGSSDGENFPRHEHSADSSTDQERKRRGSEPESAEEDADDEDVDDAAEDEGADGDKAADDIDATLARFSAVHDEIAAEEAKRRKRFAWLFGNRKEPEPGQDMPFDFADDRGGSASRVEWRKDKRRKRVRTLGKSLAVAAAALVFVSTGIGWGSMTWWDSKFKEISALSRDSNSIRSPEMQEGDLNFLLIGSDTRAGARSGDNVGTSQGVAGARSDTTMIAHIPADRSRVVIVSIPRDLEVDIPADTCESWNAKTGEYTDKMVPARNNVKFNVAYADGGPQCVTEKVQELSGLKITNFLGINFQGFKSMVDAVGGVRVCSNKPMIDNELGTVLKTGGWHELRGERALQYVRARKVVGDSTSDYGRMERQQMFLSALLRKMTSSDVLLNMNKLGDLANAVIANTFGENVNSNKLIALGKSLEGLDPKKVTFVTIPTTGENNARGNEELRESATSSLFRAVIEDKPITPSEGSGEQRSQGNSSTTNSSMAGSRHEPAQTTPSQASTDPTPSGTNVAVLNATERSGLAGNTAQKLREHDYAVGEVGNLDSHSDQTVIRYSEGNKQRAQLLASSVPAAELMKDASAGNTVRLEIGGDYENRILQPDTGKVEVPEGLWTVNAGKDVCGGVN
ncbi:LCP family protein required for cell wall assembly [Actinopolyspora biskrensis]|uniref:LCP family protein required for cell wall assembly n=1 Tax=Actinopolyspora biskrensis TaxID=1470178 RepID=A0A852YW06_9ACTN|nr:LCP family protein required for cell wall assembly [Actinopolyspora biskrensis]